MRGQSPHRYLVAVLVAVVGLLMAVGVTHAAVAQRDAAHIKKTAKRPKKASAKTAHGLHAPSLLSPANGAHVQQIPTMSWSAVSGAVEYQYEVSADPRFRSTILRSPGESGTPTTYNLAATLKQPVTDGTYYWRVRGVNATKQPGPWSAVRRVEKKWTEAPQLLGPSEGAVITWPSAPLVLHWSEVPYAYEYIVTIATDEQLSNVVVGTAAMPQKTDGTVFALPGTLQPGQKYYWSITPIDDEGHRGTPSAVRSFEWSWPSETTTHLTNLASPFGFEPQFSWEPVAGAAGYEVEVNQSPEFPSGSKWCCSTLVTGTSFTPTELLANDHAFWWRVRAIDPSGHAGVWNMGAGEHGIADEEFTDAFDDVTPSVQNLHITEPDGSEAPSDPKTSTPIVTWSAVPGASSYEVQVTHFVEGSGCNWAANEFDHEKQVVQTSSLAWTPPGDDTKHLGPTAWPNPVYSPQLNEEDTPYCVRVLARAADDAKGGQVIGGWTQIGGENEPAFTFASQPAPGGPEEATPASAYTLPQGGSTTTHTPLFTWNRVPGASSYYVVIARDANFTDVVDVASTVVPAYAPELEGEEPLADQTNAYYWAVVPVNAKGEVFHEPPGQDAPQTFTKLSVPPTPLSPIAGAEVSDQPTFQWTPAEGALDYTLQVSQSPSFANLIDNVKTDSTSYTSASTYPAYATLYWRVRANDTNRHAEGLDWSAVQTFQRTLPSPTPSSTNSTGGEAIPALSWTPVQGATAYQIHAEQPNGTTKEFTSSSPVFTIEEWDGPGIWRWQARAEFPAGGSQTVTSRYFAPQTLAHTVAPPANAQGVKSGSRIVISWTPQAYAKQYEVAISTSETFSTVIQSEKISQTSWAPINVNLSKSADKGTLYWRVAAVDKLGNVGPYATGAFVPPKAKAKCTAKKVKKGKKTVKECVAPKRKKAAKKKTKG